MATRRERVVLELEDNFTAGAARAAIATQALKREIDGLNGAGARSNGGVEKIAKDVDGLSTSAVKGSKEIDKYSGRLRLLADVALVLGPAAVVVGAGLGGMAISAGVAGLALYGLGDSLKALNAYQLEPTAENLQKLNQEMSKVGPAGREFVTYIDSLGPKLSDLQNVARAGFLPGLQDGIESLLTRFPEVRSIVADLATELGDLAAKGGEWLAGPGFDQFQEFLAYARSVGPDVAQFLGALASALVGIAEAAAPVGAVTLPILTKLLDVIAAIANSPLGSPLLGAVVAYSAYTRAASLATLATAKFAAENTAAKTSMVGLAGAVAGVAIAVPVLSTVYDKLYSIGQTNGDIEKLVGNAGKLKDFGGDVERTTSGGVGGFLDRYNPDRIVKLGGYDSALEGIKETDKALSQMVSSGHTEEAAAAFAKIAAAAKDQGASLDDVKKSFPEYTAAAAGAKTATDGYGQSMAEAVPPTQTFAQQVEAATKAMRDQHSAALGAFDAVTQYGQAMDAAQAAAAKGKRGISANTAAGRENREALSQLAAAWNNQSDAVKNNSDKFRKARADFVATATAMGVPAAAARRLARQLLEIPQSRLIKVSAETAQARSAIADIIRQAQSVPRTVRTDYIVTQINRISKVGAGSAGTRTGNHGDFADGGYTGRGGKYEPAGVVHRGEFVFSSEATRGRERELAMLHETLRGYADGGVVGSLSGPGVTGGQSRGAYGVAGFYGIDIDRDDKLKKRISLFEKALGKATDSLNDERSARDSLKSSITSGLTGDLFGSSSSGSAFSRVNAAGSVGDVNARLRQQITDARQFSTLEKQLRARGVRGAALEEVIASGDINRLRMFASANNAQLSQYQSLYSQRGSAVGGAANTGAGVMGLNAEIAGTNSRIDTLTKEVRELRKDENRNHQQAEKTRKGQAAATGHAVSTAAANGHKKRR